VDRDAPSQARTYPGCLTRRMLEAEICLVFALSLGRSGVYALVDLIASATSPGRLSNQAAVLNASLSPDRPWLDLTLQLLAIGFGLVPCLLVVHFMHRSGENMHAIGFDASEPGRDLFRGAALAAIIGAIGLGFYLLTFALGVDLTVVAENLPHVWWRIPVLVLSAVQNALLEELVVVGYLVRRLGQLGWSPRSAAICSAAVRGTYHLYQGLGGFLGNAAMGLVFARLFQRWGRVAPLVVAHALIDVVAFVGYALLVGRVGWLPAP
jgi:membrane protease YdiL (CAAX protease family)